MGEGAGRARAVTGEGGSKRVGGKWMGWQGVRWLVWRGYRGEG